MSQYNFDPEAAALRDELRKARAKEDSAATKVAAANIIAFLARKKAAREATQ